MKINIAGGTSTMGRVHKPVFEKAGHEVIISGRKTTPSLEEAAFMSDVTIISVPIPAFKETVMRIGSRCKALMDFTGIKYPPIMDMLRYSTGEVAGMHPLYGDVDSIAGRTVVYCTTSRTGKLCETVADAFRSSGAAVKEMNDIEHDRVVNGILQNGRAAALNAFAMLAESTGMDFETMYQLSPPPTRVILDLLARQMNPSNDQLYEDMRKGNIFQDEINAALAKNLGKVMHGDHDPERIRRFFGKHLKEAQERAKKYI